MRAAPSKSEKSNSFKYIKLMGIAVLFGLVSCMLIIMLFSFIISLNDVPQIVIYVMSVTAVAISAFISGYLSARLIKSKGMIVGLLSGAILFLIMYLLNILLIKSEPFAALPIKAAITLIAAGLGGILAVNYKRKKR